MKIFQLFSSQAATTRTEASCLANMIFEHVDLIKKLNLKRFVRL